MLIAVVHIFDNCYGTLHDNGDFVESTYEMMVNGDSIDVAMQVNGNLTPYKHSSMTWLKTTSISCSSGRSVCWNGDKYGDSWILTFVPNPIRNIRVDSVVEMPLTTSLARKDHHGPVSGILSLGDESKFKPTLQALKLQTQSIHSVGSWFYMTTKESKLVILPKGVIEEVAVEIAYRERNKKTLQLCVSKMRNLVNQRNMSIPVAMRLDCVIYGSAMAFVRCLEEEIVSFNSICSPRHMRLYAEMSRVLNMERFSGINLADLLYRFNPCKHVGPLSEENETVNAYNSSRVSMPGPTFDAAKAWPDGLPGVESGKRIQEIRPGASISETSAEKIEDKPQFHAVCTTFSECIPVVPYASKNNEIVSLANRALKVVPVEEADEWDKFEQYCGAAIDKFRPVDPDLVEEHFVEWNERFPAPRRKLQAEAWESLKTLSLSQKDMLRKEFVKRELTLKSHSREYTDFDPRAIQGNSDRLNVCHGPFIYQMTKQFKEQWPLMKENVDEDGVIDVNSSLGDPRITYTGGLTAEEIGKWRSQFSDDVVFIECDDSRLDCHKQSRSSKLWEKVLRKCGAEKYNHGEFFKAHMSFRQNRGYSSHGVKYSVPHTMTSGRADTSTGNSWETGMKYAYILDGAGVHDWRMVVHGDDMLCVVLQRLSRERLDGLIKTIETVGKRLGFTIEANLKLSWAQVEYCSGLFWPVDGGFVLGPKIGKRLPKMGFSLRKLGPGEVKGMLLGASIECCAIPVLRKYVKHQLSLMRQVKKAEWVDHRAVYKSLIKEKHSATEETAMFFYERYGVEMEDCEAALMKCLTSNLTDCVSYPELDIFTAIDL